MAESKRTRIEQLFRERYRPLYSFLLKRTRSAPDAAELAQEVYLRMLRVQDYESIREPEHYLLTVAKNLLWEHAAALRQRRGGGNVPADDPGCQSELAELPAFGMHLDGEKRVERLRKVLAELPAKAQAAMVLHYWRGQSYEEIASQLDVSTHMVKKYVTQSLAHCRLRMARLR
ncbi:MAG TPA: sigma-70 family RNA polymerase sigma factor [Steroidobacteraceae bacterium]|jgi:RNA polymerase sigma-70 factor (ECF subfamily)